MLSLCRIQAAAGVLVVLMTATSPARADEVVQNLGPVGPHEPILTSVGSKSIIAFYSPDRGNCAVHVVEWNTADVNGESTTGFQTALNPGQIAAINTAEDRSVYFQCGDHAKSLAIVPTAKFFAVGTTK
jgi:hypothetical protein